MNKKLLSVALILMFSVYGVMLVASAGAHDITGDGHVTMDDVNIVLDAFGSFDATIGGGTAHPRWNPTADITLDGIVNMADLILVLTEFGT